MHVARASSWPNSPLKNREPGVRPPAKGGASDPVRLPNLCFSTGCSARHDTSLQRIRSLVPFFAGPVPGQSSRIGASHCDGDTRAAGGEDDRDGERNSLQIAELDDDVRRGAKGSSSGRGGIRTHTPLTGYGILSPSGELRPATASHHKSSERLPLGRTGESGPEAQERPAELS